MEHSGSAEHGMKQQGVMGVGWWALRRVCGLGGPQGGRTRDAQGRRCGGIAPWIALGQYGKNNYDPRGACGSNKRGLRFIAPAGSARSGRAQAESVLQGWGKTFTAVF